MLVAARGLPSMRICLLIILAMVFARTAAMAFNRLADWEIDKRNPRTASRHTLVSRQGAIVLVCSSALLFVVTTWFLNPLCFALSPVALLIIFFYSLTKRFTAYTHFFLGLALAVSPVGAWLAVNGSFAMPPLILAAAVVCWVAGFDIIYATQDDAFDRGEGLHSLVVALGKVQSIRLAHALHWVALAILTLFGWSANLGHFYFLALPFLFAAVIYEYRSAARLDLAGINRAFFACNAFVSVMFLLGVALDVFFFSKGEPMRHAAGPTWTVVTPSAPVFAPAMIIRVNR
jgi:4-hydroxybenzoate polyprenyltransferase